ncbi:MAG: Uma2 family endonuclease [Lachnospiraceae bacterium]|nr:Uma2 family endonuclease [Lachnospiraceae bacterium]
MQADCSIKRGKAQARLSLVFGRFLRGNVSPAIVQETARKHTLKDYYALPEDKRVELIDGTFYDMSSPSTIHQHLAGLAYHQIINTARKTLADKVALRM